MESPPETLADFFRRNGVVRLPNRKRRKKESSTYKKGYEVRLIAFDRSELQQIQQLLRRADFLLAKPFTKVGRLVQPIYGKEQVLRFHKTVLRKKLPA